MKFAAIMIAAAGVAEARYKSGAVTGSEKFTYGKILRHQTIENIFHYISYCLEASATPNLKDFSSTCIS